MTVIDIDRLSEQKTVELDRAHKFTADIKGSSNIGPPWLLMPEAAIWAHTIDAVLETTEYGEDEEPMHYVVCFAGPSEYAVFGSTLKEACHLVADKIRQALRIL